MSVVGDLTPWQWAMVRGQGLYPWQVEALEAFGRGYPTAVATCNGAGKTTVVAGSAVDWFFMKHPRGKLVATSSSFNQLQNQTWPALASRLPGFCSVRRGSSPLRIGTPRGGVGVGFSSREAGRAEGWHPTVSNEVDPVMLLMDEAKTVPDAIWAAFDRCTLRYQLLISSPGPASGRFFECFHSLRKFYWTRQVASVECPHLPAWKRERDAEIHGVESDLYRSMHLGEFTEGGEFLIITPMALRAALELQPRYPHAGDFERDVGGEVDAFDPEGLSDVEVGDVVAVAEAEAEEIPAWCAIGVEGARGKLHAADGDAAEGGLRGEGELVDGAGEGADDDVAQ